ncbi:MAG: cell wall biosynthesis protein [Methanobacteriaceae archaeon]
MPLIYLLIITAGLLSAILTIIFKISFEKIGGNLYSPIRGGTARAVGLAPFIVLFLFFLPPYSYLIAIMAVFAFFDDIIGRKKVKILPFELGQLSRGLGILLVMWVGYFYLGPVSILVALMVQPLNIADMQPGTAASTIILMGSAMAVLIYLVSGDPYLPLIVIAACVGYAPLDYQGKIMMGEVGNHSFGVSLGIIYALLGNYMSGLYIWGHGATLLIVFVLLILTSIVIAILRRKNLQNFLETKLNIPDPTFGDYFMDVLTGGGLGDLLRRIILGKQNIMVKNRIGIFFGLRRLFYNPYSTND